MDPIQCSADMYILDGRGFLGVSRVTGCLIAHVAVLIPMYATTCYLQWLDKWYRSSYSARDVHLSVPYHGGDARLAGFT
jgi:hypothetical protein